MREEWDATFSHSSSRASNLKRTFNNNANISIRSYENNKNTGYLDFQLLLKGLSKITSGLSKAL